MPILIVLFTLYGVAILFSALWYLENSPYEKKKKARHILLLPLIAWFLPLWYLCLFTMRLFKDAFGD